MTKNIIIFFLFTFFGYSQNIISEKSTYESSIYKVSNTIYEQNDSLINCVVEFKNLSESPILISKIEIGSSYVDNSIALIDRKIWITHYGHFPNNLNLIFIFFILMKLLRFQKLKTRILKI